MAFRLTCEIEVGPYVFRRVHEVKITDSWKELGSEASIKLYNLKGMLEKAITSGMPVKIKLGYDGKLRTEFKGYVREVRPQVPFEIICEDEVYHLKRKTVNKAWRSVSLRELLQFLVKNVKLSPQVPKVTLSPFRLDRVTVAEALRKLRDEYLLSAYFREGQLFVGLPYTEFASTSGIPGSKAVYDFAKNIIDDSLTFKRKDEVKLRAKVINIMKDNKRKEVEVGDPDGELRTFHFRNADASESELKRLGERELEKYRYEGYRGSFTAFGLPYVIHSGVAELQDQRYPQRKGRYLVDSVTTTFGVNGFRREIELGRTVSV